DMAAKIADFFVAGCFEQLEELKQQFPAGIFDVLSVQGLGPKKVKALYEQLNVGSLEDLKQVAEEGKVKELSGFGAKTEKQILETIDLKLANRGRFRRATITPVADTLKAYIQEPGNIDRIEIAGSFRRAR
ncbi:MAG: helix-hairpin-helix domain-containing protein, partial [Verrucomicrobiota bacterium]